MRIRVLVLAFAALLCGYLGWRVFALERRLAGLDARLGRAPEAAVAASDYEQRLSALERDVRRLRDELTTLEKATADLGGPPAPAEAAIPEQRILSVLDREQSRIRDRQLEFHRARWLEWRASALDNFAQTQGLSPAQTEQLQRLLSDEVDTMVQILRSPDALENPDQAANGWLETLEATDSAAERVLTPAQLEAWNTARTIERRVFWPWLPTR